MRTVDVQTLSALKCTFCLHRDEEHNITVLVASFAGDYAVGSKGNGDGVFIAAETMRGLVAYDPSAVILDFREMRYSWGNTLLSVFQAVARYMDEPGEPPYPVFAVTSELCRGALLGLMGGEGPWHFEDMDAALNAAVGAGAAWLDA